MMNMFLLNMVPNNRQVSLVRGLTRKNDFISPPRFTTNKKKLFTPPSAFSNANQKKGGNTRWYEQVANLLSEEGNQSDGR